MALSFGRSISLKASAAFVLMLALPIATALAAAETGKFSSKLKNIQLCNGADRSTPEPQIKGCTALIELGKETTLILSVAYTNRGNAYAAKGDYDLAISDYDAAIKLNPAFSKPFNSRGVALQKKGEYDRAIKDFDEAIKLQPDYARAFANRAEANQKRHDYQRADETMTRPFVLLQIWKRFGMDVAGLARSSASCSRHLRIATRRFQCSQMMPQH